MDYDDDKAAIWLAGKKSKALEGAGVSALTWLGDRNLFATGDEDGKLGLWQVIDTGYYEADANTKKGEKFELKADQLQEEVSRVISDGYFEMMTELEKRALLRTTKALQDGETDDLDSKPMHEVEAEIRDNAALRYLLPSDIEVDITQGSAAKVRFGIIPHAKKSCLRVLSALSSLFSDTSFLSRCKIKNDTLSLKRVKCCGLSKEHIPRMRITGLCASRDGKLLFSGSTDCTVKVWKVTDSLELQHTILLDYPVYCLSCNHTGSYLAISAGHQVLYLDTLLSSPGEELSGHKNCIKLSDLPKTQRQLLTIPFEQTQAPGLINIQHRRKITSVSISNSGTFIAAVTRYHYKGKVVSWVAVWNSLNNELQGVVKLDRMKRECILMWDDKDVLRIGFNDSFTYRIEEVSNLVQECVNHIPNSIMGIHPMGSLAINCQTDSKLVLSSWSTLSSNNPSTPLEFPNATCISFVPTGEYALLGSARGDLLLVQCNKSTPATLIRRESSGVMPLTELPTQMYPELSQRFPNDLPVSQDLALNRRESQLVGGETITSDSPQITIDQPAVKGRDSLLPFGDISASQFDELMDAPLPRLQSDTIPQFDTFIVPPTPGSNATPVKEKRSTDEEDDLPHLKRLQSDNIPANLPSGVMKSFVKTSSKGWSS